jgi:hypothetical protein
LMSIHPCTSSYEKPDADLSSCTATNIFLS